MVSYCFVNSHLRILTMQLIQEFRKAKDFTRWFGCIITRGTLDLSFALCIGVDVVHHVGKLPMLGNMF